MRRLAYVIGIGVLCASYFFAGVTPAQAVTVQCSPVHCYAENEYEGNGTYPNAAGTDLEVNCLSVANRSTDFADWEMWYMTNTPQVSYDTWVEEGMTAGTLQGGYVGFMWFWADQRPNGTYYEHYIKNATVGNYTNVSVYYAGSNNDNVYLGGSLIGTSTGNGTGGLWANAGAEVTTSATTVQGNANNFQYRNSSGWHWAVPKPWDSTNGSGLWAISASGANLYVSTGCGAAAVAKPQLASPLPAGGAPLQQRLIDVGRYIAALTHESSPTAITMVQTTRQKAVGALSGDLVNSDQGVYVMTLNGSFSTFRHPPGHKPGLAPAGSTLTVVVDPATGQVTDWGISNSGSSVLRNLGAVTVLS